MPLTLHHFSNMLVSHNRRLGLLVEGKVHGGLLALTGHGTGVFNALCATLEKEFIPKQNQSF